MPPGASRSQNYFFESEVSDINLYNLATMQDYVVLLDERGKSMSSEGMARLLAKVHKDAPVRAAVCMQSAELCRLGMME